MTSLAQFLLVIVISILTILVAVVAIQVWQILHEVRQGIRKFNRILDNTQTLSEASAKPITAVNQFFSEVKDLVDQTQDELIASKPESAVEEIRRRFFHRSGLPLRPS